LLSSVSPEVKVEVGKEERLASLAAVFDRKKGEGKGREKRKKKEDEKIGDSTFHDCHSSTSWRRRKG